MTPDTELTARVNRLLREDPRLLAAAPLLDKVAVRYRPAPPPKPPKRKPPQRNGKDAESGEVTAPPPGPALCPSPWHKAVTIARCSEVDLNGGKWLAKATVDGACWDRLNEAGRDAALIVALRGLRHKETGDGGDTVKIEKPPIRCWPDTRDCAALLMDQLGPDGAEGAALVGALSDADDMDNLDEAVARIRRRLDAGQDLSAYSRALCKCAALLDDASADADASCTAERVAELPSEIVHDEGPEPEEDEIDNDPSDNDPNGNGPEDR